MYFIRLMFRKILLESRNIKIPVQYNKNLLLLKQYINYQPKEKSEK